MGKKSINLEKIPISDFLSDKTLEKIERIISTSNDVDIAYDRIEDLLSEKDFIVKDLGTNRVIFTHKKKKYKDLIFKVAGDSHGIEANYREFYNGDLDKALTFSYSISDNGVFIVQERVTPFKSSTMKDRKKDVRKMLEHLSDKILLVDCRLSNFKNFGVRKNGKVCLLDHGDTIPLPKHQSDKIINIDEESNVSLRCKKLKDITESKAKQCGGKLKYSKDFDYLECQKCGSRMAVNDAYKEFWGDKKIMANPTIDIKGQLDFDPNEWKDEIKQYCQTTMDKVNKKDKEEKGENEEMKTKIIRGKECRQLKGSWIPEAYFKSPAHIMTINAIKTNSLKPRDFLANVGLDAELYKVSIEDHTPNEEKQNWSQYIDSIVNLIENWLYSDTSATVVIPYKSLTDALFDDNEFLIDNKKKRKIIYSKIMQFKGIAKVIYTDNEFIISRFIDVDHSSNIQDSESITSNDNIQEVQEPDVDEYDDTPNNSSHDINELIGVTKCPTENDEDENDHEEIVSDMLNEMNTDIAEEDENIENPNPHIDTSTTVENHIANTDGIVCSVVEDLNTKIQYIQSEKYYIPLSIVESDNISYAEELNDIENIKTILKAHMYQPKKLKHKNFEESHANLARTSSYIAFPYKEPIKEDSTMINELKEEYAGKGIENIDSKEFFSKVLDKIIDTSKVAGETEFNAELDKMADEVKKEMGIFDNTTDDAFSDIRCAIINKVNEYKTDSPYQRRSGILVPFSDINIVFVSLNDQYNGLFKNIIISEETGCFDPKAAKEFILTTLNLSDTYKYIDIYDINDATFGFVEADIYDPEDEIDDYSTELDDEDVIIDNEPVEETVECTIKDDLNSESEPIADDDDMHIEDDEDDLDINDILSSMVRELETESREIESILFDDELLNPDIKEMSDFFKMYPTIVKERGIDENNIRYKTVHHNIMTGNTDKYLQILDLVEYAFNDEQYILEYERSVIEPVAKVRKDIYKIMANEMRKYVGIYFDDLVDKTRILFNACTVLLNAIDEYIPKIKDIINDDSNKRLKISLKDTIVKDIGGSLEPFKWLLDNDESNKDIEPVTDDEMNRMFVRNQQETEDDNIKMI